MGMKLAAFLILRSASLHLFSIWPTKLQRRVAPNFRARFCISSEMYGSHFWMDSDSFSTFVRNSCTLSFSLASSFTFKLSRRFSSSKIRCEDCFYRLSFIHFCGKIEFLFHRLIVLILFSFSFLTNDWRHERICEPIANRPRPCLSTEGRFANLHHLRRLLHSAFQAVLQK